MNSTPAEFERALRQAFAEGVTVDDSGLLLATDGAQLHFALRSENGVCIGALQLPLLRVEISVRDGSRDGAEKLLARVDRATLRGGG